MVTVIQRSHSNFEMGKKAHNDPAPIGAMHGSDEDQMSREAGGVERCIQASVRGGKRHPSLNELTDARCPSLPCESRS